MRLGVSARTSASSIQVDSSAVFGSLGVRAALAVVLMVLYVALAIGMILGLGGIGLAVLVAAASEHQYSWVVFALGGGCIAASGTIAWALLPRVDRFEPPGPELLEADHPALFAELRSIASATGERMPEHVYAAEDVNAFVAQRGGVMGIGSRRVMGIGLPLLRVLDVSELRAVIAHEMGHFFGGDTRLSPWIYKTRAAVLRTVISLAQAADQTAAIHAALHYPFRAAVLPFRWFGVAFMRVTQAISRAQELSADRVSARVAGVGPAIAGLQRAHAGASAHEAYLVGLLAPLVDEGVLPPVGPGFSRFLEAEAMTTLQRALIAIEMSTGSSDPYDSHPPLRERIAALEAADRTTVARDPRPAIELLEGADALEQALLTRKVARVRIAPPAQIAWADAPTYWIKRWRTTSEVLAQADLELTIATIPLGVDELRALLTTVEDGHMARAASEAELRDWATHTLGAAIACALVDRGFTVSLVIGDPIELRDGDRTVQPFRELGRYLHGETSVEAWRDTWTAVGLVDHQLGRR